VIGNQAADSRFTHTARTRYMPNLQRRVCRSYIGIEPARRARHGIDGDLGIGRQAVELAIFLG
jgi:hypothetical protein